VNRFVHSPAYVKVRAVTGALFFLLGGAIVVRTAATIGIGLPALTPLIMGGALMGLGALRLRDFLRVRSGRT
jgi:hypothetical protein